MPENKWSNEFGYSELTHDNEGHLIREALHDHTKRSLGNPIDERSKKEVLAYVQEARHFDVPNAHKPIFKVMKQTNAKAFITVVAEKTVASEKKFRIENTWGVVVKEKVTQL